LKESKGREYAPCLVLICGCTGVALPAGETDGNGMTALSFFYWKIVIAAL
jgi:hypothetical protein